MNRIYEVYDNTSGEILKEVVCAEIQAQYQYDTSANENMLQVEDQINPELYYILSGVLTSRPLMAISLNKSNIAADGVEQAIISSIPIGTVCYLPNGIEECNDGVIEFSTDMAGTYRITLENFPYKKEEVTVYAS